MASLNKVMLIGNLGKDPEVRYTPSGAVVANFSIATTEKWKNKQNGQIEEKTEWHNIVVWGKQAENCKEYLSKGRPVYIEGKLQTRSWDDKDGNKRYTTEVLALTVQFLGGKSTEGGFSRPASGGTSQSQTSDNMDGPPPFDPDDDIPF